MIKGVDISNLNDNVNMQLIKNAGNKFVICRATEGTSGSGSRDENYHKNIENAKAIGLKTGAYHFSRFANTAKEESELQNFLDYIKGTNPDMVVLDCENQCSGDITGLCLHFLDNIVQIAQPLIYCNPSWLQEHLNKSIMKYPLWIANYKVSKPNVGFYNDYAIWQYSEEGRIPGVNGAIDLNYMSEVFYNSLGTNPPVKPSTLMEQIKSLQYNLNIDYNAGLVVDGITGPATMASLKGIQDIIIKGHESHVILWLQQKLEQYGYLKENSYTSMLYDEPTFQAVTELQKAWGRSTSGQLDLSTWDIFLTN